MEDMFLRNIDEYVFEECSESKMNTFLDHIKHCEKCRAEYELALEIKGSMHKMNNLTPPADFSKLINNRLDAELEAPKKKRFYSPSFRRYSAVAACLVLVSVLGIDTSDVPETPVIETTTLSGQSFNPVPDETEPPVEAPISIIPETNIEPAPLPVSVPVKTKAGESKASTTIATPAVPATVQQTAKPTAAPVEVPAKQTPSEPAKTKTYIIPDHLDPEKHVVLASSVEKTYEISGVSLDELPKKERNLAAEFALLETTEGGDIVANTANMSSMQGVKFKISNGSSSSKDYGVGSGSIFISSEDKQLVGEILKKYLSTEENDYYFFTKDNFNEFISEMELTGIPYKEQLISSDGGNVAVKLVLS